MKKQGQSSEYVLSEQQMEKLWAACKEDKDRVLVGLCLYCGMRISEVTHFNSTWMKDDNVNIPARQPCNCYDCGKRGSEWSPKTAAGSRVIPVPPFVLSSIYKYLTINPRGIELTRQSAWYRVQTLGKATGLRIFPHSLRASYATLMATKGVQAMVLCYLCGWQRIEIANHYLQVAQSKEQAKIDIKRIWG
jgi:site-specific recombinase XerD